MCESECKNNSSHDQSLQCSSSSARSLQLTPSKPLRYPQDTSLSSFHGQGVVGGVGFGVVVGGNHPSGLTEHLPGKIMCKHVKQAVLQQPNYLSQGVGKSQAIIWLIFFNLVIRQDRHNSHRLISLRHNTSTGSKSSFLILK